MCISTDSIQGNFAIRSDAMSGGRRENRILRRWLHGAQVRRHSRLQQRRAVSLFARFVVGCIAQNGIGALSSLLSALGVSPGLRESIIHQGILDVADGTDRLSASLEWLVAVLGVDIDYFPFQFIRPNADRGVVFVSDDDD